MKHLLLTIFLAISSISSFSQSYWCQPGATWEFEMIGQVQSAALLKYTGDTLIENKNCQILQNKWRYIFPGPNTPHPGPEYDGLTSYVYYSGDTLYHYLNGIFNMLFDFGASVGDTWNIINYSQMDSLYACDSEIITVDSVGNELFNGFPYRWIKIHSDSGTFGGKAIEHVGFIDHNFFPDHGACNSQEESIYILGCFSDSLFGKLSPATFNCYNYSSTPSFNCGFYTLNVQEIKTENPPQLFPIPTTNKITYKFDKQFATNYMIYSMDGRLMQTGLITNPKGEIPLNLDKGVYWIVWNFNKTQLTSKLIIQN